ncbi:hypothetical protein [Halorussus aquaticus]|uniref:Uncharacterized protein n=1 Tax=Halorussus aquaticus TaxID=2953748 RepID=A0ABD5Q9P1_9EURY|nr:hypothetical protein [Halorussus aquaticus]
MDQDTPLSDATTVLVDANVFIALGRPSKPQYNQFRQAVRTADVVLKIPRRVIGELGGPQADRVQTALEEGWAEIIDAPDPTDGDAVAASDIAKRTIASETGQAEHDVEKTDAILAGLVVQYVRDRAEPNVVVLTDDKPARQGLKNAVTAQGYTDAITVCGLSDIIGDDAGSSMRLI